MTRSVNVQSGPQCESYLTLDYDDFHWFEPENCIDHVIRLVEVFPQIKVSLFTVPMLRQSPLWDDRQWCDRVRALCERGNLEIARHGLYHTQEEYRHCDYDYAIKSLLIGDRILDESGIPYVKVFRGPHWGINDATVRALNELGYTHLYNHVDHASIGRNFLGRVIYYNWNLAHPAPDFRLLIAHGHTHDVCGNGIAQAFEKVSSLITQRNPKFLFASEV